MIIENTNHIWKQNNIKSDICLTLAIFTIEAQNLNLVVRYGIKLNLRLIDTYLSLNLQFIFKYDVYTGTDNTIWERRESSISVWWE